MRSHSALYLQTSQVMCVLIMLAITIINKGASYFFCVFSVSMNVQLLEVISRGTYGVVHKAVWRGQLVAAKS